MGGVPKDVSTEGLDPEYLAKHEELPECVVCLRKMRPAGSKASDWPATVAYATTEQCKTCYNRKYTKPLSVHESLKALKPAKVVKTRRRGVEYDALKLDLPRADVAARWSDEERSAALQVVETGSRSAGLSEIGHVLDMLGLFEAEKPPVYNNLQDPKSDRFV